jgi:hypothetical protein
MAEGWAFALDYRPLEANGDGVTDMMSKHSPTVGIIAL